ncbi:MAG: precorrin-6y C5,15-methyltransferase (decarboxylating) subunit CbiE, partial [Cyanobacteriota bacterium]
MVEGKAATLVGIMAVIDVVGCDASGVDGLSPQGQERLRSADRIAAPRRLHPQLSRWLAAGAASPPELLASDRPAELMPSLRQALARGERVLLLASGDPLWYGIGRVLLQEFPPEQLRFHPAPSSLQLAFARLGRPWQDARWVSLHGREPEPLAAELQKRPPALAVLTDPGRGGAESVRTILEASGLAAAYGFWLCERLGHPQERVLRLAATDPLPADLDPLHLVVLLAEPASPPLPDPLPLFGLEDGLWLQHSDQPGLMTKR